jgi:cell division protein FtsB
MNQRNKEQIGIIYDRLLEAAIENNHSNFTDMKQIIVGVVKKMSEKEELKKLKTQVAELKEEVKQLKSVAHSRSERELEELFEYSWP